MSNDSTRDRIAIIFIGCGSTFVRGTDAPEGLAAKCVRQARRDWKGVMHFPRRQYKVNVWDVTGHDDVYWDDTGLFDEKTNDRIDTHRTVEVET